MSKLTNHVNYGEEVEINGEKYLLKPLPVKYLVKMFKTAKHFSKVDENMSDEEIFQLIPEEVFDTMAELIEETVNISFPDATKEEKESFARDNFMLLMIKVLEINVPKQGNQEIVDKLNQGK